MSLLTKDDRDFLLRVAESNGPAREAAHAAITAETTRLKIASEGQLAEWQKSSGDTMQALQGINTALSHLQEHLKTNLQ